MPLRTVINRGAAIWQFQRITITGGRGSWRSISERHAYCPVLARAGPWSRSHHSAVGTEVTGPSHSTASGPSSSEARVWIWPLDRWKLPFERAVRPYPFPRVGTVPARRRCRVDLRGEPCYLQQVRHEFLAALQPRQGLSGRNRYGRQRAERRRVEVISCLIEVDHAAGTADWIGEPRIHAFPPGSLLPEIDADQHHGRP